MKHFSFLISVNSPAFFMALFTSKFQQFQDQNDAREGTPRVDRKLRSKYSTSLFSMDRRSIQHTRDLHIGNVMKHILINIDKTLIVVNHSLKLRFKQSHRFFIWAYKVFISSNDRQTKFDAQVSKINMQPRQRRNSKAKNAVFFNALWVTVANQNEHHNDQSTAGKVN